MPPRLAPLNAQTAPELWPRFELGFLEFNPSFVRWEDGRILGLIRRDRCPPSPGRGMIWTLPLDGDLRPLAPPTALILDGEDPRGIRHGEDLLVFYAHFERDAQEAITGTSLLMAQCSVLGEALVIRQVLALPKNPLGGGAGPDELTGWEKNWVPFVIDEARVGLIYRQSPWEILILHRDLQTGACHFEQAFRAEGLKWAWGGIRGGTPPVAYDADHLVTFFHSSEVVGGRMLYMVGAVLFANRAPFAPVRMTRSPLLVAPFQGGVHRHGWPVAASVIFPLGAERHGEDYRLLSGVDDGEVGIFKVSASALEARLEPLAGSSPDLRVEGMQGEARAFRAPVWRLPSGHPKLDDRSLVRFLQILCPAGRCLVDLGRQAGLLAACLGSHYAEAHALATDPEENALLPGNAAFNQVELVTYPDFAAPSEAFWMEKADVDLLRVAGGDLSCSLLERARGMVERSRPVILVETGALESARGACAGWLEGLDYGVEWPFAAIPRWALAIPREKREGFSWFI